MNDQVKLVGSERHGLWPGQGPYWQGQCNVYGSPRAGGGRSHPGYHFAVPRWGQLRAGDAPGGTGRAVVIAPGGAAGFTAGMSCGVLIWDFRTHA